MKFRLYRPREGHPDFNTCQEEARQLAEEIKPRIKKDRDITPADRMRDAARKAKSLKKLAENFRVNRQRYKIGDHALRPLYVIWTMLNTCNFRCTYCDNHQGKAYYNIPDPDALDTGQGKRLLEVMSTGTLALYWCGGEPTLRKDLPELLDYAWQLGYFPNMINTNGSLLHQKLMLPEWRDFLWKMDTVIVSLDGLHLSGLNKIWGVRQARQVVVNLLAMRELNREVSFKLAVNTVITPDSIDEAESVLDLACDLDIWFVPVPVNIGHRPNRELLENPSYTGLAEKILDRKRKGHKIIGSKNLLKKLLFAEPYTCQTALKPHVWSNGQICWPCRASVNVEPVNLNLLDFNSFDEAYREGCRYINPNFFHGPAKNQCGGECAWMQNYTTARYLEGITHPLKSGLVREIFEFSMQGSAR